MLGCGVLLRQLLRMAGAGNRLRGKGAVAAPSNSETLGMPHAQYC
jgi:hypothetical protein